MMTQQPLAERLLTWLDVERLLKRETQLWRDLPAGVIGIDCFADGMEIRHTCPAADLQPWLSRVFGSAYLPAASAIRLGIGDRPYPLQPVFDPVRTPLPPAQAYPLWREICYLPAPAEPEEAAPLPAAGEVPFPTDWSDGPTVLSFHSFKGGVGRTTALMTYVAACLRECGNLPTKILIVDADLEAPGISLWLDNVQRPTVSFIQLLEALHYPPAGIAATLEFFAGELRKTSLNVDGRQRELFILPAALELTEIEDMPIAPEHIARNPGNPWQLSDHLQALGRILGVDAVFIDLRAGLSELAGPLLFDPRIDHFFVSTVAPQSVLGMAEILRRLYAYHCRLPGDRQQAARPTVIISMLTKELREAGKIEYAQEQISAAYPGKDELTPGVEWLEADFNSSLMSVGSVREALELPQSGRFFADAREWAQTLYAAIRPATAKSAGNAAAGVETRVALANSLSAICNDMEFADTGATTTFLATEPLVNLGKQFARETPNLLMIGAKGAGKTFTFWQLVRAGSWPEFLGKLGVAAPDIVPAVIFPVLWSHNIEDRPGGEIKAAQTAVLDILGGDRQALSTASHIRRLIEDGLATPTTNWEDFWCDLISRQFAVTGGISALNTYLAGRGTQIILVFDGIEDAFPDATAPRASEAIYALLRLPSLLSELENRHIGVIVFVREDYVRTTIRQNPGQLLHRFQPFRLQWNPESFLRLSYMLSCLAGIIKDEPKQAETLRVEELKISLERLWGRKLGREESKEAHSARWVYSALCDLRGDIQARDLIRFLKLSAELEAAKPGVTSWPDRILSPESMRKAIPLCSKDKVSEAIQEIAPLRKWVDLMTQKNIGKVRVPFSQQEAGLDSELLIALKEIGVIYEDEDLGDQRLFLPEIYRAGLGFETSSAGRPRSQSLLKKNIGIIPL